MNKQNTKENSSRYYTDTIWKLCEQTILVTWCGLKPFIQKAYENPFPAFSILGGGYYLIMKMAEKALHLKFLNWAWPSLFSGKFMAWLCHFPAKVHYNFVFFGLLWGFVIFLGAKDMIQKRKLKEIFEAIGLMNRFGQVPILVYKYQMDQFRESMTFNAMSIGTETFESKKSELEAAFGKPIESIKRPNEIRYIEIIFSTKKLPDGIDFHELAARKNLKNDEFYVGEM